MNSMSTPAPLWRYKIKKDPNARRSEHQWDVFRAGEGYDWYLCSFSTWRNACDYLVFIGKTSSPPFQRTSHRGVAQ
jgi:hypothetical protein